MHLFIIVMKMPISLLSAVSELPFNEVNYELLLLCVLCLTVVTQSEEHL
jgi:hypothetical protein